MKSVFSITILSVILAVFVFSGCDQKAAEKSTETNSSATKPVDIKRKELTENAGYAIEVAVKSGELNANQDVAFDFFVKDRAGKAFDNLKVVHEKLIHLLVVSDDLAFFDHVHPEKQNDGSFKLNYKFPTGGVYKLYADFTLEDSPQIVNVFDVNVGGEPRQKTPLKADVDYKKTIDGLTFTMKPDGDLKATNGVALNFYVTGPDGKAIADLEPYLGAMAHFVVISEDASKFLHVHAEGRKMTETKGTGGDERHGDQHGEMEMNTKPDVKDTETPTVMAHTEFPTGGLYKLWGQFQRNGKVITVPFVVNVAAADSASTVKNMEIPKDAYKITVSKNGFSPDEITLDTSKFSKLAFLRTDSENCGSEVVFTDLNIRKKLPVGEVVMIDVPSGLKGKTLNFACGMNMMKGKLIVQ